MDTSVIQDTDTIAQKTKTNYISAIKKLNGELGKTKLSNVKKVDKIIKGFTDNPNSQGNFYSAIMKFLDLTNQQDLRNEYKKLLKSSIQKHDKKKKVLSKTQKEVGDDYPSLKRKYRKFLRKERFTGKMSAMEFVLSFYVLLPPRRSDYWDMIYTEQEEQDENTNYIFRKDKKVWLVFNKFKNVKSIGKQKFFVKNRLLKSIIMARGLKEGDRIYPKSRRQFSRDLGKVTLLHFGKKLGINDLRIIHNTTKFKNVNIKELEKDAELMGHTTTAKIKNYIR